MKVHVMCELLLVGGVVDEQQLEALSLKLSCRPTDAQRANEAAFGLVCSSLASGLAAVVAAAVLQQQ
jgi:hypothetical protein